MSDANAVDTRKGDIAIGATLVLAGVAIVLDRAGVFQWRDQWTLWPLIIGGVGVARFFQSVPGEPKQGLLHLTGAAWLFLGEGGWVSLADSWPIAIIVLGLLVAFNGGRRRRWHMPGPPDGPGNLSHNRRWHRHERRWHRHDRSLSPLGVLGLWIAIVVAFQMSGIRSFTSTDANDRARIVAVMGSAQHISRAEAFHGADVTAVMGRSVLDLREAIMAPGTDATVHVLTAMGNTTLRVPAAWAVDTGAVTALGQIADERPTPAAPDTTGAPAPRLVLRGLVMFGRLAITSQDRPAVTTTGRRRAR